MTVKDLISEKRDTILSRWFDVILSTYPSETSKFMKKQKDRFANPVGHSVVQGLNGLFDCLIQGSGSGEVSAFLDDIIRVRALQDFSAAQALSFIFQLKSVVRDELAEDIQKGEGRIIEELFDFESLIDEQVLLAFNIYLQCRERIYEIRANEVENRTFRLLQQANLICNIHERDAHKKERG